MLAKSRLLEAIQTLPDELFPEVLDFVEFIQQKYKRNDNHFLLAASETSLAKDWLSLEEDAAWLDL